MNTFKQSLIIISLLISGISLAQNSIDHFKKSIEDINVIVLRLDGYVKIVPLPTDQIISISTLNSQGEVWGISFPDQRPEFKTQSRQSKDTLYIRTPSRFSYSSIGINTYNEKIETILQISSSVQVIIEKSDKIEITAGWSYLNIIEAKSVELNNLNKSNIKSLLCHSEEKMIDDGQIKPNYYTFEGNGSEFYSIKSNYIKLIY